jgi:hypothetical protein
MYSYVYLDVLYQIIVNCSFVNKLQIELLNIDNKN